MNQSSNAQLQGNSLSARLPQPTMDKQAMSWPQTTMIRIAGVLLALSLTSCATYRPSPLSEPAPTSALVQLTEEVSSSVNHPLLAAHPIALSQPLSDLDVARVALISSPELATMRASINVAEAQLFAAGLVPDPQLSLSLDRPDGIGLVNALGASLAVELSALVSRSSRIDAASDRLDQVRLDVAWTEWLALNQARVLTRRIQSYQAQRLIAAQASEVARALHERSQTSLQNGDARLDDTALLQAAYVDAHDRLMELERRLENTERELNALLGLAPQAHMQLAPAQPPKSLSHLSLDDLVASAGVERLDVRALRAGFAAQEVDLKRAHQMAFPLPQLALSRSRDTSAIWTRGVAASVTLPLWNRNRGDIAISSAGREFLRAEYRARVLQIRADISATLSDLRSLDRAEQSLSKEMPEMVRAEAVVRLASANGDVSMLVYESLRSALLDKQLRQLSLQEERSEAEVALETAAGRLLWGNE